MATLASCSVAGPDPFLTTQAVTPEAPAIATDVSADFAAAYLPTFAGAIRSVRQQVRNNSLKQDIVYANQTALSGENMLTVEVGAPETAGLLRPPSQAQLRREMRSALAGLNPVMSPVIGENGSGPYGYAVASTGKDGSCIYAWQYVRQVTPADSDNIVRFTRKRFAASLRLRYCHPSIPADRIHVLMDGVRIKDINSQTIDMLRFAAGTAGVDQPPAVVTPDIPVVKRVAARPVPVEDSTDWRPKPGNRKAVTSTEPVVVQDAAMVPLPDAADESAVAPPVNAEKDVAPKAIPDAAEIPLPE
jgi:hypothetical protein